MTKPILKLALVLLIFISIKTSGQTPQLWGLTSTGGIDATGEGATGTIYKINGDGNNFQLLNTFRNEFPGNGPVRSTLLDAGDGKLYGLFSKGGLHNGGVLYAFDPVTEIYTVKFNFDGANSGSAPTGSLIKASNGKLYGLASSGGLNGDGTLFEFNFNTGDFIKKIDFNSSTIGAYPVGHLTEASNGKLYGATAVGGSTGTGTIYEYDPATNTCLLKVSFGFFASVYSGMTLYTNGKLYGLASSGGSSIQGFLYEYNPLNNAFTIKINFWETTYGSHPKGDLMLASDGKLYGMTSTSHINYDYGLIFQYNPNTNSYVIKYEFNIADGANPEGTLVEASNGKFYGLTAGGGMFNGGTMFEYDLASNTLQTIYHFDDYSSFGSNPEGGLIEHADKIYGVTAGDPQGSIFSYNINSDIIDFPIVFDIAPESGNPHSGLMQASNGNLYATTTEGGFGYGSIIEVGPDGQIIRKKGVYPSTTGSYPEGNLIQEGGNLYTVCTTGDVNYMGGTLISLDFGSFNIVKKLHFSCTYSGINPRSAPCKVSNGKWYGLSYDCAGSAVGALYEYNHLTNICIKKVDFVTTNGSNPFGSVIEANNGKLYGMTSNGGTSGKGVLFEYNIETNVLKVKVNFSGTENGAYPFGDLIQASNGKLYGVTSAGGANDKGCLFEYTISGGGTLVKKVDFDGSSKGSNPLGSLMEASDGNLYGYTNTGGNFDDGVIFKYDISANAFTKIYDFKSDVSGANPMYGALLEPTISSIVTGTIAPLDYLPGEAVSVSYTASGSFDSGNLFTVELSDAMGSFVSAVPIGTLSSTTSGNITAAIPDNTPYGTAYRIRVTSSTPALIGTDNGSNITIGCSTPDQFDSEDITSSSANLTWSSVPGVVKYKVKYKIAGNNPWSTVSSTTTSKLLTGLSPNTKYTWKVKSICQNNPNVTSPWSEKQTFMTLLRLGEWGEQMSMTIYPNPFSSHATISFYANQQTQTVIELYSVTGSRLKVLLHESVTEGNHSVQLDREGLSAGIYFLRFQLNDKVMFAKVVVQ